MDMIKVKFGEDDCGNIIDFEWPEHLDLTLDHFDVWEKFQFGHMRHNRDYRLGSLFELVADPKPRMNYQWWYVALSCSRDVVRDLYYFRSLTTERNLDFLHRTMQNWWVPVKTSPIEEGFLFLDEADALTAKLWFYGDRE